MTNPNESTDETSQAKPSRLDKCLFRCLKNQKKVKFVKKWGPVVARVSLGVLAGIILISSLVGLFNRSHYLVTFKEEYVSFPYERDINGYEFVMRVASHALDPPVIEADIAIKREDGSFDHEPVNVVSCRKEDIDKFDHKLDREYIGQNYWHKLLCLEDGQHMRLQGNYIDIHSRTLVISIYTCYTTACKNDMNTRTTKDGGFLEFFHKGTVFDPQQINDPLRSYVGIEPFTLTAGEKGWFGVYVMPVEIISDVGLIGSTKKESHGFTFDRKDITTEHIGGSESKATLLINLSNRKQSYQRTYKKLQTMLAELAGIVSASAFLIKVFILPYFKQRETEQMVKQAYKDQTIEEAKWHEAYLGQLYNWFKLESMKPSYRYLKTQELENNMKERTLPSNLIQYLDWIDKHKNYIEESFRSDQQRRGSPAEDLKTDDEAAPRRATYIQTTFPKPAGEALQQDHDTPEPKI